MGERGIGGGWWKGDMGNGGRGGGGCGLAMWVQCGSESIKTGLKKINMAYSHISLADVCAKLSLESEQDTEFIVAKCVQVSANLCSALLTTDVIYEPVFSQPWRSEQLCVHT